MKALYFTFDCKDTKKLLPKRHGWTFSMFGRYITFHNFRNVDQLFFVVKQI